jgi:hypothetical protein
MAFKGLVFGAVILAVSGIVAEAALTHDECICPTNWAPVCGVNDHTYSNACVAKCSNATVQYLGPCGHKEGNNTLCECAAVDLPVCGDDKQTYNNACEAACMGVEVASNGACEVASVSMRRLHAQTCMCPQSWHPVCGDNQVTYANPCKAECDGVTNYEEGAC